MCGCAAQTVAGDVVCPCCSAECRRHRHAARWSRRRGGQRAVTPPPHPHSPPSHLRTVHPRRQRQTPDGPVTGLINKDTTREWLGIPFATPPGKHQHSSREPWPFVPLWAPTPRLPVALNCMSSSPRVLLFLCSAPRASAVGDLRWKAPQPVTPWTTNYDAFFYKPACACVHGHAVPGGVDNSALCTHTHTRTHASAVWLLRRQATRATTRSLCSTRCRKTACT